MEISESTESDMGDRYLNYLTDPKGTIKLKGITFYKIISKTEFTGLDTKANPSGKMLLLRVDNAIGGNIGDCYIDEHGTKMKLDSTEMIHINEDFPDWYWNTVGLAFYDRTASDIGDYLARVH